MNCEQIDVMGPEQVFCRTFIAFLKSERYKSYASHLACDQCSMKFEKQMKKHELFQHIPHKLHAGIT